ncbi:integrase catalytic domain-containing protein [Trichonephila clavipes]|nr:integrase catalytic domain-containing protein [Trichonephila clavipes]
MEQKTNCAPIPKLESMKLIEEIKNWGIAPSDLMVNENFCLYESNVNEIHGVIGADYAWKLFTDSMNALYWIKKEDSYATFIANRVNEIRNLTDPEACRHIQGKFNPADLSSRGNNPKVFFKYHCWEGPDWFKLLHEEWPTSEIESNMEIVILERRIVLL